MKAISLWQPWASLLVLGLKRFETRDYPLPHSLRGERVAIHAAKKRVVMLDHLARALNVYLGHYGLKLPDLPHGAVVGVVDFKDSYQMGARIPGDPNGATWDVRELVTRRCPAYVDYRGEHALGDFRLNRLAWEVVAPVALRSPIPYSGSQGVFHLDLPTSTEIWNRLGDQAVKPQPITREITRPILNEGNRS